MRTTTYHRARWACIAAIIFAPLFLATTCPNQRPLDPAGAYQGDRLLWEIDGVIVNVRDVFKDVIALADRNPAAVAANPRLAEGVAKIRAELTPPALPSETLVKLYAVRDAYNLAKTATNAEAVRSELVTARTVLQTARNLLPLFVQPSTTP